MKIFVCIKQVPDTETKIRLKPDGSGVDFSGVKWVMNPYDEIAVEEAIKSRESGKATSVTVLSVGPKVRTVETLRTAMAMGADDAIAIDAADDLDSISTARALAAAIRAEGEFGMVLAGKVAIDDNAAAVPQMVAEFLDIPHGTVISKIELTGSATVEREIEGGTKEILELSMPMLIAANKGLNLPRYASLPGIMKAKKKPIKELTLELLGLGSVASRVKHVAFQLPTEKPPVKMLDGDFTTQSKALAQLLRSEAKVL